MAARARAACAPPSRRRSRSALTSLSLAVALATCASATSASATPIAQALVPPRAGAAVRPRSPISAGAAVPPRSRDSAGAASSPPRRAPLTGFISAPTDQVAVPGYAASGELTPEGDLYTGWAEYELRIGPALLPWDQPTRTLPNPSLPRFRSTLESGGVRYTETVFAVPEEGMPVAYETIKATDVARTRKTARVAMAIAYTKGDAIDTPEGRTTVFRYARPVEGGPLGSYSQPGQAFSEGFEYSFAGRDLDRSGLVLARGPRARSVNLLPSVAPTESSALGTVPTTTPEQAAPTQTPTSATAPVTPTSAAETALHDSRLFTVALAPRHHVSYTWQIPLAPPTTESSGARELETSSRAPAERELTRAWASAQQGATQIDVPEPRVDAAYHAAIVQILDSRIETPAGTMQTPNRLQYQAYWIRDAAIETNALDLVGLDAPAEQNIDFFGAFQREDGLLISQEGQYDELGEALWAIGRHAELTRSRSFAEAQLPRVAAAIAWLANASAEDPLGLLPPAEPKDDERVYGHITGDDLWAADGLGAAIATARIAGDETLAGEWQQLRERFDASLGTAVASAVAANGYLPPALDAAGGEDWGNYNAAYPEEALAASSPEVTATLAYEHAHASEDLPTYYDGHALHGYLGFRIFETQLEAGDRSAAIAGLYAELDHTTSTFGGWELLPAPFRPRASQSDLEPHGTFAAEYIALLRNMLLRETSAGAMLLLSGASPAWLGPGKRIVVSEMPTAYGPLSFEVRSSRTGERLHWHGALAQGAQLDWVLPPWARELRLRGGKRIGRLVALRGDAGTIAVRFGGRRPAQSYARAVGSLDSYYRRNGEPAPLVPARR